MIKTTQKLTTETSEVNKEMRCSDCNSEMSIEKESGYMKQYKCDVCGRIEILWTVCVAP
jgi:transposase-like protein